MQLNMFRASLCPSSGAYQLQQQQPLVYLRNVVVAVLLAVVGPVVGAGCGRGRGTKKTKAIRCGACYYSIVLNAPRVTSMADTDIDAVRKQKKAECDKQYRLKRKLLLQQEASKDIYMIRYFHP
jgi:hypothetical protein